MKGSGDLLELPEWVWVPVTLETTTPDKDKEHVQDQTTWSTALRHLWHSEARRGRAVNTSKRWPLITQRRGKGSKKIVSYLFRLNLRCPGRIIFALIRLFGLSACQHPVWPPHCMKCLQQLLPDYVAIAARGANFCKLAPFCTYTLLKRRRAAYALVSYRTCTRVRDPIRTSWQCSGRLNIHNKTLCAEAFPSSIS